MTELSTILYYQFRDEDTAAWISAARKIGKSGDSGLQFIRKWINNRRNLHAHRHSWCALGMYLSESKENPSIELLVDGQKNKTETLPAHAYLRQWLANIIVSGCALSDLTLGEISGIQSVAERRNEQVNILQRKLDSSNNIPEQGKVALARKIEIFQSDQTPLKDICSGLINKKYPLWDPWTFSSFIAGVSPELLKVLEIPLELLTYTCALMASKDEGSIAYLSNLPRFLLSSSIEPDLTERIASILKDHLPPVTAQETHWINYMTLLADWLDREDLNGSEYLTDQILQRLAPDDLKQAFVAWRTQKTERDAIHLIRTAEGCFCGLEEWREKTKEEQMALPVFFHVMQDPGIPPEDCRILSLAHRVKILQRNIDTWADSNRKILVTFVRLLKCLLYKQLLNLTPGIDPSTELRSQIYIIQPLVERWNLKGTVDKDLATIAARILSAAYRMSKHRNNGECIYKEFLYTLLHAVPERNMIKDLVNYTLEDDVNDQMETLSEFMDAVQSRPIADDIDTPFGNYIEKVWSANPEAEMGSKKDTRNAKKQCDGFFLKTPGKADVLSLVKTLIRREPGDGFEDISRDTLRWFVSLHERWMFEVNEDQTEHRSKSYTLEKQSEIELRVEKVITRFDSLITDIAWQEQIVAGSSQSPIQYIHTLNDLNQNITRLRDICRQYLPFPEREYVTVYLKKKKRLIEERIKLLGPVFEEEKEAMGLKLLNDPTRKAIEFNDRKLIQRWMLKRFMLSELAPSGSILKLLLDWRVVIAWVLFPFLLASVLKHYAEPLSRDSSLHIAGYPFLLMIFINVVLIVCFVMHRKNTMPGLSRASLLMPQMVGALFLGIMESFGADESWSMAFLTHPMIRVVKIAIFSIASYYFVRNVMLGSQSPWVPEQNMERRRKLRNRILRKRTLNFLSLGLWQAFTLINLFSMLQARVMCDASRANLFQDRSMDVVSKVIDAVVPHILTIDLIMDLQITVLPWAIFTWTVQLFFFSVIFERIMNR